MELDDLHAPALPPRDAAAPRLSWRLVEDDPARVELVGELDREGGPSLVGLVDLLAARDVVHVVVDLGAVAHVDLAGMRALVAAADGVHARGGSLRVRGARATARTVATVLGRADLLDGPTAPRPRHVTALPAMTPAPAAARGLAEGVLQLAAVPVGSPRTHEALGAFAGIVLRTVPGAGAVSVQLGSAAEPVDVASTSHEAAELDGWQVRTGEGPCVQAGDTATTVVAVDVRRDARWPRFARAAGDGDVVCVVSSPLLEDGRAIGGVNVYGLGEGSLDVRQRGTVETLAAGTRTAVQQLRVQDELRAQVDQLRQALVSRATIDEAKGIVVAHRGGTPDEAFLFLSRLSQHRNVKLRDLAREMVEQVGRRDAGPATHPGGVPRPSTARTLPSRRGSRGEGA